MSFSSFLLTCSASAALEAELTVARARETAIARIHSFLPVRSVTSSTATTVHCSWTQNSFISRALRTRAIQGPSPNSLGPPSFP